MFIFKKSLGQHFLKSEEAVLDIVHAADIRTDDIVIEIGPGEGVMTESLISLAGKVIAFEKDHRLIPVLQEKFKKEIKSGKFELHKKDILEFDPDLCTPSVHKFKIVANIPYYITGKLLRKFLETKHQPESITLLLQKEVAERIVAKDGKENLLSLSVKAYGQPKYIKTVPAKAFRPEPKVDSAILHIKNISRLNFEMLDEKMFFKILHAGFAHKRKLFFSNLKNLPTLGVGKYKKEDLAKTFEKWGINLKSRAEDIPLEMWIKLCQSFFSLKKEIQ